MIPLRTWNVISPIFVRGTPHTYSDETLSAVIDPKSNRMIVSKKAPGPGDPNVPVYVPMANVACYTTVSDHEAADELQKPRPEAQPSA